MYDIREAITESTLRSTIRNLPQDLAETYARILEKVWKGSGGRAKIELMEKVVQWICCARRPLLLAELEEAVGLDQTDTYLHYERVAANSGEKLVSACGNLVVYDRDEKTVALAHHTVEQFLCNIDFTPTFDIMRYMSAPYLIFFDKTTADHHIGKLCIAYLRFTDFEQQVMKAKLPMVLDRKDAEHIICTSPLGTLSLSDVGLLCNTTRLCLAFATMANLHWSFPRMELSLTLTPREPHSVLFSCP
jgi:hypothetical protein